MRNFPTYLRTLQIAFVMTLLYLTSCKRELVSQSGSNSRSVTIEDAKQFYERNFTHKSSNRNSAQGGRSIDDSSATNQEPQWDAATTRLLQNSFNAVVAPLYREGVYSVVNKKQMVPYGFLNFVMMYKDENNQMVTEWVALRPSAKWLAATKNRPFDGDILVSDLDGNLKEKYFFADGSQVNQSVIADSDKATVDIRQQTLARTGVIADGGPVVTPTNPDDENTCEVTTYVTTTTVDGTVCGCPPHHTWEQAQNVTCDCEVQPTKGRIYYVYYTTYFCPVTPAGPTPGGGDPGGPVGSTPPAGATVSSDYPPVNCNNDPNYSMPTTPPPAGSQYMLPCSQVAVPVQNTPVDAPGNAALDVRTKTQKLIDWYNLDPYLGNHISNAAVTYLNTNTTIAEDISTQLLSEDPDVKTAGQWAIEYLAGHPSTDYAVFKNRFLYFGAEGGEPGYDAAYWNTTGLTFPQQTLPAFSTMLSHFLHEDPMIVFNTIGGAVLATYNSNPQANGNACATRISRALNYSGVTIPVGTKDTYKGADGKAYFMSAAALLAWMKKTFPNFVTYTAAQGGTEGSNFPTLLNGRKGIYMMVPAYPAKFQASGHADLYDGSECQYHCYFSDGVAAIYFWPLN